MKDIPNTTEKVVLSYVCKRCGFWLTLDMLDAMSISLCDFVEK